MNREFVYFDNKYVLLNDEGLCEVKEYYHDLDKILILENEKEQLVNKVEDIRNNNCNIDTNRPVALPVMCPVISLVTARTLFNVFSKTLMGISYSEFPSVYVNFINSNINSIDLMFGITAGIFVPIGTIWSMLNLIENKLSKKIIDNNNEEIISLRKSIDRIKSRIKDIQNNKEIQNEYHDNEKINLLDEDVKKRILKRN